ncbi:putative RNA-directed DNA polymerase [Tanacetum coccineum]
MSNRDISGSEDSGSKSQRPDVIPSDKAASDFDSYVIEQEDATFDEGNSTPIKENTFIQQESSTLGGSRTYHLRGIYTSEDISDNANTLFDDVDEDEDFGLFGNIFESEESARDYVVDKKVKYGIDKSVNYANLSKDNFVFATSLNKIIKPKTYLEAASDHRKPMGCKWVFKVIYKSGGSIERFKARLVAKGFNQKEEIDYEETFSPVVKIVTIRCIISLAVSNSWPMFQLDINNAFMYGELVEDVYMKLPVDKNNNRVCRLTRSLYGLKQAPRKWNEKLTSVLKENGFKQSKNDPSLFIKSKNGVFIVLLVYVDDIVVTGNNIDEIEQVKQFLHTKLLMKDLGKLQYFLGMEVLESESGVCLTHRKFCLELLAEFGMFASKLCSTPIEFVNVSSKNKLKFIIEDKSLLDHCLSQVMHSHHKLAFRVLSKKQSVLTWSSAEAELRAMCSVTCKVMWMLKFYIDLKVQVVLPVDISCDNSSAMQIAANPVLHEKTKHFEIDLFFLTDKIADGTIRTIKVKSEENVADLFTKIVSLNNIKSNKNVIGLIKSNWVLLKFKARMQKYTRFDVQSLYDAMIFNMDSIGKYMLEITLHQQRTSQLLKQKMLMHTQEDHSNPIPTLNADSLKVDLVVIQSTCSEKEYSNSKTASSKSVKECSLNSETKDVRAIKYKMSKAKERRMAYF